MVEDNAAAQRQTAVTAYLKSKQLLLFVFVLQYIEYACDMSFITLKAS